MQRIQILAIPAARSPRRSAAKPSWAAAEGSGLVRRVLCHHGCHHACPDRIEVHVGERGVVRIQDARVEPALPQSSPAVQPTVEILGVLFGDVLHQAAHAAFFLPRPNERDSTSTYGQLAKRRRALLKSNPPRDNQSKTHPPQAASGRTVFSDFAGVR